MMSSENLEKMVILIRDLKNTAEELNRVSDSFPALNRNTNRILASVKMLEINLPFSSFSIPNNKG